MALAHVVLTRDRRPPARFLLQRSFPNPLLHRVTDPECEWKPGDIVPLDAFRAETPQNEDSTPRNSNPA